MRRTLAILAISFFAAICVSGQPNKATVTAGNNTEKAPLVTEGSKGWWEDSSWWLVIIAFGTACVIGWQSRETRKAAQGAKQNVEVFVAAQRPQIMVTAHDNPPRDLMSDTPRVQLELTNQGPTAALGLVYESWIEVLPFPFVDFTANADYHKSDQPVSVYPGQQPVILNIPIGRVFSAVEREELKRLKKFACIRVKATYRDGLYNKQQWASFGYWVQSDGLGFLEKYNDCGEG
jgi:hypothetical protein